MVLPAIPSPWENWEGSSNRAMDQAEGGGNDQGRLEESEELLNLPEEGKGPRASNSYHLLQLTRDGGVVLAHDELARFCHSLPPISSSSLHEVDFDRDDRYAFLGVVGNDDAILRFLWSVGALPESTKSLKTWKPGIHVIYKPAGIVSEQELSTSMIYVVLLLGIQGTEGGEELNGKERDKQHAKGAFSNTDGLVQHLGLLCTTVFVCSDDEGEANVGRALLVRALLGSDQWWTKWTGWGGSSLTRIVKFLVNDGQAANQQAISDVLRAYRAQRSGNITVEADCIPEPGKTYHFDQADKTEELFSSWLLRLVCLVPLRIACETKGHPEGPRIVQGGQLSNDRADKNLVEFGIHGKVLEWWRHNVQVLSGHTNGFRSDLLQQLFPSPYSPGAPRKDHIAECWLSLYPDNKVLYVVLDCVIGPKVSFQEVGKPLLLYFTIGLSRASIFNLQGNWREAIEELGHPLPTLPSADPQSFTSNFCLSLADSESGPQILSEDTCCDIVKDMDSWMMSVEQARPARCMFFYEARMNALFSFRPASSANLHDRYESQRALRAIVSGPPQVQNGALLVDSIKVQLSKFGNEIWQQKQLLTERLRCLSHGLFDSLLLASQAPGWDEEEWEKEEVESERQEKMHAQTLGLHCLDSGEPIPDKGIGAYLDEAHPLRLLPLPDTGLKVPSQKVAEIFPGSPLGSGQGKESVRKRPRLLKDSRSSNQSGGKDQGGPAELMTSVVKLLEEAGMARSVASDERWMQWAVGLLEAIARRRGERVSEWAQKNLLCFAKEKFTEQDYFLNEGVPPFLRHVKEECGRLIYKRCEEKCDSCGLHCFLPLCHRLKHCCRGLLGCNATSHRDHNGSTTNLEEESPLPQPRPQAPHLRMSNAVIEEPCKWVPQKELEAGPFTSRQIDIATAEEEPRHQVDYFEPNSLQGSLQGISGTLAGHGSVETECLEAQPELPQAPA
eukprot:TRINITY_DN1382_c0_g2_i3.p1 TRINITY_DN1382_c0_g2~~TRINITY_DN1382_c0_g2_i3.p1  ORF type:complete len:955 (-),score=115.91 TRINITY_DN1382_c0_g2_i3:334-3198(-)